MYDWDSMPTQCPCTYLALCQLCMCEMTCTGVSKQNRGRKSFENWSCTPFYTGLLFLQSYCCVLKYPYECLWSTSSKQYRDTQALLEVLCCYLTSRADKRARSAAFMSIQSTKNANIIEAHCKYSHKNTTTKKKKTLETLTYESKSESRECQS